MRGFDLNIQAAGQILFPYFRRSMDLVKHLRSSIGLDERQENKTARDW